MFNQMDMNQTGINPIGINQNGLNPMLMNQMGINQMMMNQMGLNPMLINNQPNQINPIGMDNTTLNIKNLVQPYENKIKELEEIIRQKDFEITILKHKLNNNNKNNNFMNINPMIFNQNMNPMMMMENKFEELEYKGEEIQITVKSQDEEFKIKCLTTDKISSLKKNYNIKAKGGLTYNHKLINGNLSLVEAGITNDSIIHIKPIIMNVTFRNTNGMTNNLCLSNDCPIGLALIYYLMEYPLCLWSFVRKTMGVSFVFNAQTLDVNDETIIFKALKELNNPKITVNYF